MKSPRTLLVPVILCLVVAGLSVPMAQTAKDEIELTRAVIQAERQAIITKEMRLTESESEAFWPVYREYRNAMSQVNDRTINLIKEYAENYENLSDELAQSLLDEFFKIEKASLDVKTKYVKQFDKVLTPKKVVRFYQVENKLDAIIDYDLAAEIPLVR